jgi:hypothetical protein
MWPDVAPRGCNGSPVITGLPRRCHMNPMYGQDGGPARKTANAWAGLRGWSRVADGCRASGTRLTPSPTSTACMPRPPGTRSPSSGSRPPPLSSGATWAGRCQPAKRQRGLCSWSIDNRIASFNGCGRVRRARRQRLTDRRLRSGIRRSRLRGEVSRVNLGSVFGDRSTTLGCPRWSMEVALWHLETTVSS